MQYLFNLFFSPTPIFFQFFLNYFFWKFFFTDFFPAFWQKWPPLSGSMSEIHKSVYSRLKLNWIESNWGACCRIVSFLFASNVVSKCSECEWHRRSRFLFFFFVYSFLFLDLSWQVFFLLWNNFRAELKIKIAYSKDWYRKIINQILLF